uniref:DOD-type homing endonuclease domain-containing protein n=1 Tax=viral metagenome TaxID=1070528 RepID=A0A6C0HEJ3_9ZZZZ
MNRYSDKELDLTDNEGDYKTFKSSKFHKRNKFNKHSRSRSRSRDDTEAEQDDFEYNDDPEELVYVKEFNMNDMLPRTVEDKGTKIVVIGKPGCFAPGTKVLMYDGSIKNVEDVKIGDVLMGDDNTERNVLELYHDFEEMFDIIPNKGETYTVNRKHDLVLVCTGYNNIKKGEQVIISVDEYLKKSDTWKRRFKLIRSSGIEWTNKEVSIDPYLLGLWLGDGTSATSEITNIDEEVLEFCKNYANINNLRFDKKSKNSKYSYRFSAIDKEHRNELLKSLKEYNLIKNKHIPFDYKVNDRESRLQLLAGIIDTDGYLDQRTNNYDIILKSETLLDDIIFIARSLGFSANKKVCEKSCVYKGEIRTGTYYRCCIYGYGVEDIPCKILRKQIIDNSNRNKNNLVSGFTVVSKGQGEYFGFSLDKNRLFLLASFDIVKNTGKSSLIQDIVAHKAHIIPVSQVFSGTEESNHFYSEKMPPITIFNKLDMGAIKNFVERQDQAKKFLKNPWALQIIDDCTDNPKILRDPVFQAYYKNGRHWKMLHILSLQYCLDVSPAIRTCIDYTFILKEGSKITREKLWKNYGSCIEDFADFCQLMDQLTNDFTALVINNRSTSNKLEDCVFYYKADLSRIPINWKFGAGSFWQFNHDRLNQNFVESFY